MLIDDLTTLLSSLRGATFASIDTETMPTLGIRKVTKGTQVLLFANTKSSGYESMVKRRLAEAGFDPDSFTVGELPFGERVDDLPVIVYNDNHYLQTIVLREGSSECFIGSTPVDCSILKMPRSSNRSQGLPSDKTVKVATYKLDSILEIRLLGETLPKERETLTLKL